MGLGGATVVSILARADGQVAPSWESVKDTSDGRQRLGYNPAMEERKVRKKDFESVKSRWGSSKWASATFEPLNSPPKANL